MSELAKKINDATSKLMQIQQAYADAEASANAHEEQARADRRQMAALKKEREELNRILSHAQVAKGAEDALAAAQQSAAAADKSRKEQESQTAEVTKLREELQTQLDELRQERLALEAAKAENDQKAKE